MANRALAILVGAAAGVSAGIFMAGASADDRGETYRQLDLFGDVFERVRAEYVEEVTDEALIEAAITGMLTSLDPHSTYLPPENFEDMQVQTRGAFGGLGIEVTMENGLVKVVSPIDDTPAAGAGLQAGDYITHLDGEQVLGLTLNEAVDRMRGDVGTDITLTILREDVDPFDVVITRDIIRIRSVRHRPLDHNIGYVRITSFTEQTEEGLEMAVDSLVETFDGDLNGLVLDLRNNPGGLLEQAIAVADAFLVQGEIVSTRGRDEDRAQRFDAEGGDLINGLPMVVLINGGSASASEIVAGALQDHGRAVLLGTESFGKGSVQTIVPLPGHGAMRLTTSRYYTPSGRSIQALGIDPDIEVEQARLEEIDNGLARREADLRGALDSEAAPAPSGLPEAEAGDVGLGANADGTPFDYQLSRAIDIRVGVSLFNDRVDG